MTQLEAALGTLLLIAIVVAMQCWMSMRVAQHQYRELRAQLDRYRQAWKKARTP